MPADLVIFGIGATPNDQLARKAGIRCENGIRTDEVSQTLTPAIRAVGDFALNRNRMLAARRWLFYFPACARAALRM